MTAPAAGVKIRMYRQGLGDCFLLAFATGAGRPCYMLIDCGVLLGTQDAGGKMRQVAESLRDSTGGRIDVLVATHQHWDHLSGFDQAREIFDEIDFGEVWVGWTEDPGNELANRLRARRRAHLQALSAAARSLRAVGAAPKAETLEAVLGFFGDLGVDGRPSRIERGARLRARPRQAAALPHPGRDGRAARLPRPRLRARAAAGRGAAAALGPLPQASEVYEKRLALDRGDGLLRRRARRGGAAPEPRAEGAPGPELPVRRRLPGRSGAGEGGRVLPGALLRRGGNAGGEGDGLAADRGGLARPPPTTSPCSSTATPTTPAWPWRSSSRPAGKVLLFPGDAQVGNWLSWRT